MRVAGFGFRKGAAIAALQEALELAGGRNGLTAIATVAEKSEGLREFANSLQLPLCAVSAQDIARQQVLSSSARVQARFNTGSLAEAAALAAAGPGAKLIGVRVKSSDGMATAAIAERKLP